MEKSGISGGDFGLSFDMKKTICKIVLRQQSFCAEISFQQSGVKVRIYTILEGDNYGYSQR